MSGIFVRWKMVACGCWLTAETFTFWILKLAKSRLRFLVSLVNGVTSRLLALADYGFAMGNASVAGKAIPGWKIEE